MLPKDFAPSSYAFLSNELRAFQRFLQFHFFYIFLLFFLALSSNENRNEAGNIKQNARMDADDFGMGWGEFYARN